MQVTPDFHITIGHITKVSVLPTAYQVTKTLLGITLLMLVLLWCYYRWRYRRTISVASKLYTAGLRAYPIVGHLPVFLNRDYVGRFLRILKSMPANSEQSACLWIGPFPMFIVSSPEDIYTILNSSKTLEKSVEYSFLKTSLGNGLLTAPSHIHRVTRRYLTPLFTPWNLKHLLTVFNENANHLVQDLSQLGDRGLVDVFPLVEKIALRNVSCLLFGPDVDIDRYSEELEGMNDTITSVANQLIQRTLKFWLWSDIVFYYLWSKEMKKVHIGINNYADIPRKNNIHTLNMHTNKALSDVSKPITISDTFKSLGENHPEFTDQYWKEELITLAGTGTDSTKVIISYCLLALALDSDIQDRLYQEVVSVIGVEDRDLTLQDIKDMPYLDQVFKETLRHSCVVPIIGRTTAEDIKLKNFTIPAGNTVAVSLASLNFNPELFPNAHQFDPDHFAPENVAQMERYSFLPFSGGSRYCIGNTYANLFTKIAIVHVLRKFRLSSTVDISKLVYHYAVAMYFKDGYHMTLELRNPTENICS